MVKYLHASCNFYLLTFITWDIVRNQIVVHYMVLCWIFSTQNDQIFTTWLYLLSRDFFKYRLTQLEFKISFV